MDMLSPPPKVPPSRLDEWPTARAKKGKFYGVNDPVHEQDQLCVMLMETWVDVGTIIKQNEQVMKAQNGRIVELKAANDVLAAQLRDANERLNNLRRVRRKEKRAELEQAQPELAAVDKAASVSTLTPKFL